MACASCSVTDCCAWAVSTGSGVNTNVSESVAKNGEMALNGGGWRGFSSGAFFVADGGSRIDLRPIVSLPRCGVPKPLDQSPNMDDVFEPQELSDRFRLLRPRRCILPVQSTSIGLWGCTGRRLRLPLEHHTRRCGCFHHSPSISDGTSA